MRALLLLVVVVIAISAVVLVARLARPAPPVTPPLADGSDNLPAWHYFARAGATLGGTLLAGPAGGTLAYGSAQRLGA